LPRVKLALYKKKRLNISSEKFLDVHCQELLCCTELVNYAVRHFCGSHHRDNVTAPHGRPNLRSRLQFCHAQEGRPRSPQGHVGALGEEKKKSVEYGLLGFCTTPVTVVTRFTFIFLKEILSAYITVTL